MLKDAIDLTGVHRALVIKLRHHGDVLLASPVFTVLRNHAPHLEIDALVYEETGEMLSGHPAISEIHPINRAWRVEGPWAHLMHERRLLRVLRDRHYDLIVHLTENPRGAVLSHLLGARYAVVRDYGARRGRFWRASFTHTYRVPAKPRHTVEIHLDALRRLGIQPGADERGLTLVTGPGAEGAVNGLLEAHQVIPGEFIHIHPTSRWMFKCWEADKFAELINRLQDQGERVVLTAAPAETERQYIGRIVTKLRKPAVDLSGRLSLKQLAALTSQAKCFVGVDSVPMHIAAAMQTPVVALFGPSGDLEWGPWQVDARVITSHHSCRPCGMDGCAGSKVSECLTTIPVDRVYDAVRDLIGA
jgi:heptosyltransferase III